FPGDMVRDVKKSPGVFLQANEHSAQHEIPRQIEAPVSFVFQQKPAFDFAAFGGKAPQIELLQLDTPLGCNDGRGRTVAIRKCCAQTFVSFDYGVERFLQAGYVEWPTNGHRVRDVVGRVSR